MWVGLLLGLLVATAVGLLLFALARHRGKETQFGYRNLQLTYSRAALTTAPCGLPNKSMLNQ